jgi:hypothetical protein
MRAYSYEELGGLKNRILDICEQVRRDNPTAWREAHNGNFDDTSTRYNDLCVQALRADGIFAGCNGKRGGDQRSDDVLAFGLTDTRGAQDRSGRFPSMAIIDFIAGAGGPNPSLGWNDVSQAAPGRFLEPQGLPRVDGNPSTPPPPPPDQPPTNGGNPVPPPQNVDLGPVLSELQALRVEVRALTSEVATVKDGLFKEGPPEAPSVLQHIDDVKKRVDRNLTAINSKSGGGRPSWPFGLVSDPETPDKGA